MLYKPLKYFLVLLPLAGLLLLGYCTQKGNGDFVYLNHHDTVKYVGIDKCASCHGDVYQTYIHTGMGQSFYHATQGKSAASFRGSETLHDTANNITYIPYWKSDTLMLHEFRLDQKGDTVFSRYENIAYIIGSGQHTNSHLWMENGYVHQAPFTFYTQEGRLDLPPGFEGGNNTRFSRMIGLECMSCHNAMPTGFVAGSENKFEKLPLGIDCERCHGPGEAHVKKILAGNITDTAVQPDYSIVNPKRLSADLQFQVCQRCHLQGNTVLAEGKSFFDFKPGMMLQEVMDIYLPRHENSEDNFIMASHVDRFKMSKCYIHSKDDFNCTSCHNPHVSVRETNLERFNQTCKNCHTQAPKHNCTLSESKLAAENFNCVKCHMPASGSTDIPHVSVHDHYIRKPVEKKMPDKGAFLKLISVNNNNPNLRSKINAYLQYFERFESEAVALDSAKRLLAIAPENKFFEERVLYFHLVQKPEEILRLVKNRMEVLDKLDKATLDNRHAWTAYRIAEAFTSLGRSEEALPFLERATKLAPYNLDFQMKKASALWGMGRLEETEKTYRFVLDEFPKHAEAHNNLGYFYYLQKDLARARHHLRKAVNLQPDYTKAQLNLAGVYFADGRYEDALALIERILENDPNHPQAKQAWQQLRVLVRK